MPDIPYSGLALDRAPVQRSDERWVRAQLRSPATLVVPIHEEACFLRAGALVTDAPPDARALLLGRWCDRAVFVVDRSADSRAGVAAELGAEAVETRAAFPGLTAAEAAIVAHARGLCHWLRHSGHCPTCGNATVVVGAGSHRECPACRVPLFPRIEPAVMVLIQSPERPPRILLARHRGADVDRLAPVAGFVEIGESLEDAVAREVAEEVGLHVVECRYLASQPWPFPAGLMIGFAAVVRDMAFRPVDGEIVDARWLTAAELAARRPGPPDSLNRWLLRSWVAASSGQ